jgi:antitoxin PrlF
MPTATLTSKGQITLPKSVRDGLGVKTGDRVEFVADRKGGYRLRAGGVDVRELKGLLHQPGRKPVSIEEMEDAIRRRGAPRR